ncbi:MAG TPA: hypothetical protein VF092_12625 [Longimicrobium sp.]
MSASVPAAREPRARSPGGAWVFAVLGAWLFVRPVLRAASSGLHAWANDGWAGAWTDAWTWADSLGQAAAYLAPLAAVAVGWRSLGRHARIAAVAILGVYSAMALPALHGHLAWLKRFAADERMANERMRVAVRAMRVPPETAVMRALAAGDSSFLAVVGVAISTPGVYSGCVLQRYGERAIQGTGGVMFTPNFRRFQFRARDYARRYNAELARRLGVSHEVADLYARACEVTRRVQPWPPGGR